MDLAKLIPETRIEAESFVFLKPDEQFIVDLIHEKSKDAEVVFFGLAEPDKGKEMEYARRIELLAGDLPVMFFVKNSILFTGELLESDIEKEDI